MLSWATTRSLRRTNLRGVFLRSGEHNLLDPQEGFMAAAQTDSLRRLLASLPDMLPTLEAMYKDIHAHPELSMQETRTAGLAANHLGTAGTK